MRKHLHTYTCRVYARCFPYQYGTLEFFASSSSMGAIYALAVRQVSALPAASFRCHLAVDTLAVQLAVPLIGPAGDFHP